MKRRDERGEHVGTQSTPRRAAETKGHALRWLTRVVPRGVWERVCRGARRSSKNSQVRIAAVEVLGQLGEHAAPAVPALAKCLEDKISDVRTARAFG